MRGSFFNSIPWWVYVIVMVVGLALAVLFFILFAKARRRATLAPPPAPGMPGPGGGTGFLIGAIVSLLLLLIAPLVIMLIAQPWSSRGSSSRSSGYSSSRDYDDNDSRDRSDDRGDSGSDDTAWVEGRWSDAPNCDRHVLEFNAGGSGTAIDEGDRQKPMTWSADGDRVNARVGNDGLTVTRDGSDRLRVEVDGDTLHLDRCS